jgi:hypothetical protein
VRDPVLVDTPPQEAGERTIEPWTSAAVSRAVGWIGAVLAAAALADYALALVPTAFGNTEWEFGTISEVFAGLPLLSVGLAAVWVSAAGLGRRWLLILVGVVLLAAAAWVLVFLVLFATDIPTAIRATQGVARLGINKLVAKTLIMGLLFGGSYVVTGVLALKQARGILPKGAGA